MNRIRKIAGFSLLFISCVAWAVLPVIPFLPYEDKTLLAMGGSVFLFAEITWWLAIPLLGKEVMEWSKMLWDKVKAYTGITSSEEKAEVDYEKNKT